MVNKKWGYIDYSGKVLIPPKYNLAFDFDEDGFAVVSFGPPTKPDDPFDFGRPAIINKSGEILQEGGFASLGRGRFCIREGKDIRIVWLQGAFQTAVKLNNVRERFQEGLLLVQIGDKWGFMDERGALAIPATLDDALAFREGLAPATLGNVSGFIDHRGQWQIKPQFETVDYFREGIARVTNNDRCFYIDASGKRVFEKDFQSATYFSEGLAAVLDEKSNLRGYIDKTGQFRVLPKFRNATVFQEGFAAVVSVTGVPDYINHAGESVIPLPSGAHDLGLFKNGLAPISLDHGHGYIDTKGRLIWSMVDRD